MRRSSTTLALLHGHFAGQQAPSFPARQASSQRSLPSPARYRPARAICDSVCSSARARDRDSAKARVESARAVGGEAAEFLRADRARGRGVIRLGLRAALHGLPQQTLDILRGLNFQMPKVLIAGGGELLDRMFQPTSRTGRERKTFGRGITLDGRSDEAQDKLHSCPKQTPPCKKLRCAPMPCALSIFLSKVADFRDAVFLRQTRLSRDPRRHV